MKLTKIQEQTLLAMYRGDPWTLVPITRRALLRLQLIAPPKPYALTELGQRLAEQLVRRDAESAAVDRDHKTDPLPAVDRRAGRLLSDG